MSLSLLQIPLEEMLQRILEEVLSSHDLGLEHKGAIFLNNPDKEGYLKMAAHKDLAEPLIEQCSDLPFGHCLCGRAAQSGELVFADCIDERHDVRFPEIKPHGHYCMPIQSNGEFLGVLNLYVPDGHNKRDEEVRFISIVADTIAGAIRRKKAEEEVERSLIDQKIIADILRISLLQVPLEEMLQRILEEVLSSHGLGLEYKGAVFLKDPEEDVIVLKAHKGLANALLTECARLPFGHCLCGRAAQSGELVFADCIDERHEVRFPGIKPHGHYCMPIHGGDELLGVLNLYVPDGHSMNETEVRFVTIAADAIAGVIRRKRTEDDLFDSEERLRNLVEYAGDDIFVHDFDGNILRANQVACENMGYTWNELKTMNVSDISQDFDKERYMSIVSSLEPGKPLTIESEHRRKDGSTYPVEIRLGCYHLRNVPMMVLLARDITERNLIAERIHYMATHDGLTNLPNRRLSQERLGDAVATARRNDDLVAVLFLDLDGFKTVNDSHGHEAGDLLLRHVAERLRDCVRETDTVGRHGGDEFTIILTSIKDREGIVNVCKKIIESLSQTIPLDDDDTNIKANIGASIGIAMYPEHGSTPGTILQAADAAMYRVKQSGKNNYAFADAAEN